jgi:acyl carrier protein
MKNTAWLNNDHERLIGCFLAVFPQLNKADVSKASNTSVAGWDSVALVTLLATIEEEFGIQVDPEQMEQLNSFDAIFRHLQENKPGK